MTRLGNRGSWSLIGLLVVVVIVVVAAALLFGPNGPASLTTVKGKNQLLDAKSKKKTVYGKSLDTAKGSVCMQQLAQIRQGIQAWKATQATEGNPQTLKDIGLAVGQQFYRCPMTDQPYTYDPATGTVRCPTHTSY